MLTTSNVSEDVQTAYLHGANSYIVKPVEPRSAPVKATAHTTPSRLTIVPHMSRLNPPLPWFRAAVSAVLRLAWLGRLLQSLSDSACANPAAREIVAAHASFAIPLPTKSHSIFRCHAALPEFPTSAE